MALVVQKYGGSSVSDAAAMKRVAKRIVATKRAGHNVVVVVSAMGDTTDDLLDLAASVTQKAPQREMDMLLSAGERISMSLLAMAVNELGETAISYTGQQAGVQTDNHYGKAHIVSMVPERVARSIHDGNIAIVAGFQGVNERKDVTTLGRGGSDTTAVALAASLHADVCEIYTDVDGMFTADPRLVPKAKHISATTFEETLEMAAHGAKILHLRAVEFARRYHVPLHVRSSFSDKSGTWISDGPAHPELKGLVPDSALTFDPEAQLMKETPVEEPIISGLAHDRSEDKITLVGVPDEPGRAAHIFEIIARAGANIDMIVQNVSTVQPGATDLTITLPHADAADTVKALEGAKAEGGFLKVVHTGNVGKLSLVGAGMRTNPGVSAKLFGTLSKAGINIDMISTSEIRLSVLVSEDQLDEAVRAVHSAFGLDAEQVEAVVYGGTGR